MKYTKTIMLMLFCVGSIMVIWPVSGVFAADEKAEKYQDFSWVSPNGWEGAVFDVPTWFAKDMLLTGREVIRFHDGFYDENSMGFWTYAFGLLVEQTQEPTTAMLIEETERYFVGLARELGDKKDKSYPRNKIHVKPVSEWMVDKKAKRRSQNYQLEIFDSFTTGKPIVLNVKITSWLCSEQYRAIHYALSPHDMKHPVWQALNNEVAALKCG